MKPKQLRLLLPAALLCALFSCSKRLTREEAAEAIIKHYDFPSVDIERISGADYSGAHLNPRRAANLFGGIQIGKSSDLAYYREGTMFRYKQFYLTEKGFQFLAPKKACDACIEPLPDDSWSNAAFYCVATNIWEFKEVTGITTSEDGTTATIDYIVTAIGVNTFGEYLGRKEGMEEARNATMQKYDDGSWRIKNEKPKCVVKASEIPFYASKDNNRQPK